MSLGSTPMNDLLLWNYCLLNFEDPTLFTIYKIGRGLQMYTFCPASTAGLVRIFLSKHRSYLADLWNVLFGLFSVDHRQWYLSDVILLFAWDAAFGNDEAPNVGFGLMFCRVHFRLNQVSFLKLRFLKLHEYVETYSRMLKFFRLSARYGCTRETNIFVSFRSLLICQ